MKDGYKKTSYAIIKRCACGCIINPNRETCYKPACNKEVTI